MTAQERKKRERMNNAKKAALTVGTLAVGLLREIVLPVVVDKTQQHLSKSWDNEVKKRQDAKKAASASFGKKSLTGKRKQDSSGKSR